MFKTLLVISLSSFFVVTALADTPPAAAPNPAAIPAPVSANSLEGFLRHLDGGKPDKQVRYVSAYEDLNGDGKPEAIVVMVSNGWCGSGGCTMFVLTLNDGAWTEVSRTTITRAPISVLPGVANGWHNLGVWVQGGGIQPGYEARLSFDGKSYPLNPTVPPAQPLGRKPVGRVLIASIKGAEPLYGSAEH